MARDILSQSCCEISFLAATFMLSLKSLLSTSLVIHLAPATPTMKAPASAENVRLSSERPDILHGLRRKELRQPKQPSVPGSSGCQNSDERKGAGIGVCIAFLSQHSKVPENTY